jgi:hypothetical protein
MRRPLDVDWITESLAIGSRPDDEHVPLLARELGIRHVVDLRSEDCDDAQLLGEHGIELLHLPTEDACAIEEGTLREGVAWVNARIEDGGRILVHCAHGIGRSALLSVCVLVSRGDAPLQALERAKTARSAVAPNPAQLASFVRFCAEQRAARSERWPLPSFPEMAEIAYRSLAS